MKIVELVLDDDEESGIEAISIVESPAIESDFIALKSDEIRLAEVDSEKKILIGALLIPNKPIYRKNEGEEYYIYFSRDTVLKASQRYLTNGYQSNSTLEHSDNLQGLTLVESWIVEDEKYDKSRKYGLDVPIGTWMGTIKVNNDEIWNDYVKTGKVKGFSIEGFFADKIEASKQNNLKILEKIDEEESLEMISLMKDIVKGNEVEMESYSDYPDALKNNAKRGIDLNKKVNNKCATEVGKIRAATLAQGKPVSVSVIKRMYSYLSRAKTYYDPSDTEACGTISYLLWGGLAGLRWSKSKLKELDELSLAEIGPRGGVRRSEKAPASDTKNPNPKGKGTAKGDAKDSRSAKVSKADEKTLQKKSDDFNEKYKKKLGYGVTVGMLKAVFQRGLGAFNTSHSPRVRSAKQWAQARVNAFLYLVKNGRPQNKKYTTDYDLLPSKHPKKPK